MKTHLFLKRLLFVWVLAFSASLWGQTVVDYTFVGTSGSIDSNISFTTEKNTSTTAPAFNTELRLYYSSASPYNGGSITLTPLNGATITGVQLEAISSTYTPTMRYTIGAAEATTSDPMLTIVGGQTTYTASGLSVTSKLKIRNANTSNTQGRFSSIKVTYTMPVSGPTITASTTSLSGFTYVEGSTVSPEQTFTVSGSNLTANLTVTPTASFQVSTSSGTGFSNSVTLVRTGTNVAATTIYARLEKDLTAKNYTGNIALKSTGATTLNVSLSGVVTAMPVKPTITAPASQTGTVGAAYSYQIVASESPTAYAVSTGALPLGLSLNTTSGLISGTPTVAGPASVTVTATNGGGTSDPATISFDIAKGIQSTILPNLNKQIGDANVTLPASTQVGLTINYSSNNTPVASVSGNTLTVGTAGTATVTASNTGNANYEPFSQTFTVDVTAGPPPFTMIENFDYTVGQLNGKDNWTFTSTNITPVINVTESSINYPGYLSSGIGNEVSLSGSGQDVNKIFTSQESGSIYASFLVNVSAAKSGGDYFFNLGPNPIATTYRGRVFVKSSGAGIQFGVSNAGTAQYNSTVYNLNTTYLIVLKYNINSSGADAAKIFINPILNAAEPTTGWTASNDLSIQSTIGAVALRQGGASSAPFLLLDGIRIATKWADIVGVPSTTWNGATWSNGTGPDATTDAVINGSYVGSFESKSLTVIAGQSLTVSGFVKAVDVTNEGNILVSNNANFVQTGTFTAGGSSTFKVNRSTQPVVRLDYNSWSSPMLTSTQKLSEFSPGTLPARFMTYTGGNFVAVADANATFTPGQGYLIRTPNTYDPTTPTAFQGRFVGTVPNSGTVTYTPTGITGQYVFLGNPYPSAISMADFAAANSSQMVADTFYIWNSQAKMVNGEYSNNNYVTHTAVGSNPLGSANFVPVGQGFFVDRGLSNTGAFTFTDEMRRTAETGTFAKAAVTDKFWLQMAAPSGLKPQLLIAFTPNASAGYDAGYDGKMFENSGDAIYSTVDSKSLVINALAAFSTTDAINVAANFSAAGNYTMSIAQKEGLFENGQQIYLKDHVTGVETELTSADYTFAATAGLQADRFTVSFSKGVLASSNVTKGQSTINTSNQVVYINGSSKIGTVEVYDMSGKLMKTTKNVNATSISFALTYKGLAIVKLVLENGEVVTKKIILN